MLNGIDIVYWINLDKSNDRRDNMTKIFEDDSFKDIKNERFPAIYYIIRLIFYFSMNTLNRIRIWKFIRRMNK
jgi:hypothetical protein